MKVGQLLLIVLFIVLVGGVAFLTFKVMSPQVLYHCGDHYQSTPCSLDSSNIPNQSGTIPQATQGNQSQEIDIPAGSSQSVIVGDCVDTFSFSHIHAQYVVIHDNGADKRVKITQAGSVDGKATIYRNSGCYA